MNLDSLVKFQAELDGIGAALTDRIGREEDLYFPPSSYADGNVGGFPQQDVVLEVNGAAGARFYCQYGH